MTFGTRLPLDQSLVTSEIISEDDLQGLMQLREDLLELQDQEQTFSALQPQNDAGAGGPDDTKVILFPNAEERKSVFDGIISDHILILMKRALTGKNSNQSSGEYSDSVKSDSANAPKTQQATHLQINGAGQTIP